MTMDNRASSSIKLLLAVSWSLSLLGLASSFPLNPAELKKAFSVRELEALGLIPKSAESARLQRELQEGQTKDWQSKPKLAADYNGPPGFYHGVASGDPFPDAIVIWTRWTPETAEDEVTIEFRMAKVNSTLPNTDDHLDPSKNPNMKSGLVKTTGDSDWIVKLDIQGLDPGSSYIYGFLGPNGETSRVGLTKTAPALDDDVSQLQYAVMSCARFQNGYFHVYDAVSTLRDLDLWIHLGDFIYEFALYSEYGVQVPERQNLTDPIWETVSLQDYRLRYALYHTDEALQNLRARAPQVSTWDDHEIANDVYWEPSGGGGDDVTGAGGHQETCPVDQFATVEEKEDAWCERSEGPPDERIRNAVQAYLEWMPLRKGPFGTMAGGTIDADITQVIEWGNLATLVVLDSRLSERSSEPSSNSHFLYFTRAITNSNVSAFDEEPLWSAFQAAHDRVMEDTGNDEYTMIGDSKVEFLREIFAASKAAGKPWQIYGHGTMFGPTITPNLNTLHTLLDDPEQAEAVKEATDEALAWSNFTGAGFRVGVAMAMTQTPWNGDDYNGYRVERNKILDICKTSANNCVLLGGDMHDAYAWQIYDQGAVEPQEDGAPPVAINLGTSSVTAPGWEDNFGAAFSPSLVDQLGGDKAVNQLVADGYEDVNPGLVFNSVGRRGFIVVTATPEESRTEYYGFDLDTILTNYEEARASNNNSQSLTAPFSCDAHLITKADEPGILTKLEEEECAAVFDTERPALWDVPLVPRTEGTAAEDLVLYEDCGMNGCLVDDSSSAHALLLIHVYRTGVMLIGCMSMVQLLF